MALFGLFGTKTTENVEMIPELTENVQGEKKEETASPDEEKKDEKHLITQQIHALRMEYLTVNGAQDVRPAKLTPPTTDGQPNDGGTE